MAYLPCILLFHLLIFLSPLSVNNLTLPHQHPNPEAVVHEVQRRILTSVANVESKDQQSCQTGNPIDDCWRCDPNWPNNRQQLADCAIGFGQGATGGKGGQIYVVADPSDNDVANPTPGTLRHAVIQTEPLWIVFSADMDIKLKHELVFNSFKTIDGRGANVGITGGGCITIQDVNNIIIHNIRIYDCVPTEGASIRMTPALVEKKGRSDGDGITVRNSRNIWVDHCTLSHCTDGLLDCTEGSTAITISNNLFTHHEKVMLLGHTDDYEPDKGMQVTVAFNHFGEELVERMPRCRNGYFHVVNNDYTQWKLYAIGGSANPTIYSQGNRFVASNDPNAKEVTKRMDADEGDWRRWNWISEGDLMVNGAVFTPSGQGVTTQFTRDSDAEPKPATMIDQLTSNSGVLVGAPGDNGRPSGGSDNSGPPNGINNGVPPGGISNGCPPGGIDNGSVMNGRNGGSSGGGTVYWNKATPPTTTSRISFYLLVIFLYITSSYGA